MFTRLARGSFTAVRCFTAEAAGRIGKSTKLDNGIAAGGKNVNSGGRDTLGRRLLSLVFTKRSAVITIAKWQEEGHSVQKYELNRIIRELRRLKRYKHALEICEWMRKQEDVKLQSGDFAVHLDLIAKIRGLNSAEKFFEDLPDKMKDHTTYTALLHTYTQHKMCDQAEALMAKMSEFGFLKHPLPYNHILTLYISGEQLEKVPRMIQELKKNTSPDVVTYNLWLSVCAIENDIQSAEEIYLEMKKERIEPDWITFSTLANIYIKNSLKQKAASCLGEMEKRISKRYRSAYSSLISLHTGLENKDQVFWVWKKLKSLFPKLNNVEYMCMIASLLKLDELNKAEKVYTEWESVSPVKDPRIPNLLLSAYINKNQMEKAEKFYNHTVGKGFPSSYNTLELLTRGYLKQNQMEKVLEFFKRAIGSVKKWEPDETIVEKVFAIVEEHGYIEGAEELLVKLRRAGYVTSEIYNSLLRTYAKAGKMPVIVAERMKKDNVNLNDETHQLIELTSKMCIAEIPDKY